MNENKTNINWYPGHMAKTKRLIKEKINQIDIVYELIDARIPFSSKIVDIDNFIQNKPKLLLMTKYDLCDKEETKKWIEYYKNIGYNVLTIDPTTSKEIIIKETKKILEKETKKLEAKGINKSKARVLIVGIPNVGKSTLINKLSNKKVALTGNKPGVTKDLSWIRIDEYLELLDTPGILWPKFETEEIGLNLASLTAIKEEILPLDKVVIYILRKMYNEYPEILKERYNIDNIDDIEEVLTKIGKIRGCLIKGGIVDYDKVYSLIISDVKNGIIKGITFDKFCQIDSI